MWFNSQKKLVKQHVEDFGNWKCSKGSNCNLIIILETNQLIVTLETAKNVGILQSFLNLNNFKILFTHLRVLSNKASLKSNLNRQLNVDSEKNTHFEVFKSHRVDLNTIAQKASNVQESVL